MQNRKKINFKHKFDHNNCLPIFPELTLFLRFNSSYPLIHKAPFNGAHWA